MKKKAFWSLSPAVILLGATLVIVTGATFFLNPLVFYVEAGVVLAVLGICIWRLSRMKADIGRYLTRISGHLDQTNRDALALFPLPVVVASEQGEVLWYNEPFRNQVLDGGELFGDPVETVDGGAGTKELGKKRFFDMEYRGRCYTVYTSTVRVRDTALYVLYYVDNTHLKEIAEEYALSRPAVMMVYIDNIEELMQNIRDSERAQLSGRVETLLEDWISITSGILRKFGTDHFMVVVETPMLLLKETQHQLLVIAINLEMDKLSLFNVTWDKLEDQINVVNQTFMMLKLSLFLRGLV